MKQILEYLSQVRSELAKVVWPKKSEVIKFTVIVFIISGVVGAYLSGLDLGFTKLVELLVK